MDIVAMIVEYMAENCITYEAVARALGMTRNNLWMRLNKRKSPGFGLIRDALRVLGFQFEIVPVEGDGAPTAALDLETLMQAPELESVDFYAVKGLVRACGYDLTVKPPKK